MPFKSKKQMQWMFINKPTMAKQWLAETPDPKKLPNKKKPNKKKK